MSAIGHMVEQLMLAQHGRTATEDITPESYLRWDQGYVFDALQDQRYGQSFCNYFGITDNLLFYERNTDRARQYIQKNYIDAVSSKIPPATT